MDVLRAVSWRVQRLRVERIRVRDDIPAPTPKLYITLTRTVLARKQFWTCAFPPCAIMLFWMLLPWLSNIVIARADLEVVMQTVLVVEVTLSADGRGCAAEVDNARQDASAHFNSPRASPAQRSHHGSGTKHGAVTEAARLYLNG